MNIQVTTNDINKIIAKSFKGLLKICRPFLLANIVKTKPKPMAKHRSKSMGLSIYVYLLIFLMLLVNVLMLSRNYF